MTVEWLVKLMSDIPPIAQGVYISEQYFHALMAAIEPAKPTRPICLGYRSPLGIGDIPIFQDTEQTDIAVREMIDSALRSAMESSPFPVEIEGRMTDWAYESVRPKYVGVILYTKGKKVLIQAEALTPTTTQETTHAETL